MRENSQGASAPPGRREPDPEAWLVAGQPLHDTALRARLGAAVEKVGGRLAELPAPAEGDLMAFDSAEAYLDRALDAVGDALDAAPSAEAGADLRMLVDLQRALGEASLHHRSAAFAQVQEGLARLHDISSIEHIMRQIAEEVLGLGFSRVILSRVQDSVWMPEIVLVDSDPEWAGEILRAGREAAQLLDHMLLETEMVRRRIPMLVRDVQGDPRVHRPIADASLSRSYVTAPIMPEGRVIGFIHADCYVQRRDVDEFDRDLLWMFAEGAGYAFERTALLERQRDLRDQVTQLTGTIHDAMDAVVDGEIELARLERGTAAAARSAAATLVVPDSHLLTLLTRRELEVARLMSAGMTNAEMARRLVISEGTIKTHVSHVLRKLRAANRAQAVSRFVKLAGQSAPD